MDNEEKYKQKREQRTQYAKSHTEKMDKLYKADIKLSIEHTCKFEENVQFPILKLDNINDLPEFHLWDCGSTEALFKSKLENIDHIPTILNFASFKNPGGGFIVGTNAQEENLCQESYLYNVLKEFNDTWYEYNRNHTNKGMYLNRGLFSPDIKFFNHGEDLDANVITVASPNISNKSFNCGEIHDTDYKVSKEENSKILKSRLEFILNIACHMNCENLILGAIGCGVFKQDPLEVATIFKDLLYTNYYGLKQVIFAIPDKDGKNYKAFEKVLGGECYGIK